VTASGQQQPPAEVAQPSWLNGLVRIGGDRAIAGPTNWAALSHQQLYDAVCGNNDPGVVFDVSDRWVDLGNSMLESVNTLHQQVVNTASGWEGDAADSARNAVIQLVDWGGKASQTAQFMGHQLNQQAQVMATAKANMPQPQQFDLNQATAATPGMAGLRNSLVDMQVAAHAADEAHARAVDVARAMESASIPIDSATPEFEPVPTVRKKGVATAVTPVLPADGPALRTGTSDGSMARQPQAGNAPAVPGIQNMQHGMPTDGIAARSVTPAGLSAPGTAGSGYTAPQATSTGAQPGPGQPIAGGQAGSWQPGATTSTATSTSWYTPGMAATPGIGPGGFVPPAGGDPSPLTTTPSAYPGPGPWVVPSSSENPQPAPGGSGTSTWTDGNPWSTSGPDGAPFSSGGGGPTAGAGIGPDGLTVPGVGSGVGSAAGEQGYRPGTISSRLGGSSGGAGSGSGALGADEAERAGTRAGSAGGAAEPGAPGGGAGMSGARRGRKEDDKEHKSAGYVHGDDDIFEPLGGDLAPPVIGERRPAQPK